MKLAFLMADTKLLADRKEQRRGGRAWFIAPVLKTGVHASGPGVRIPPPPPRAIPIWDGLCFLNDIERTHLNQFELSISLDIS